MFFLYILNIQGLIDCDNVLKDKSTSFIGLCNNKWSNLKPLVKPLQVEVGYAWVQHKLEDFNSKSNTQDEMDSTIIPCVIGPDNYLYIVDHHHELSALDYSGYTDVSVTVNVICDKRSLSNMDEFWNQLKEQNLVYLGAHPKGNYNQLPEVISTSSLPSYFSFTLKDKVFLDDPWRALASFTRKVNNAYLDSSDCSKTNTDECYRSFYRGCKDGYQTKGSGVAFFEFRWAYFFLDGSYYQTQYWTNSTQLSTFLQYFQKQEFLTIGSYNLSDWEYIASLIIPLARNIQTGQYLTPASIFQTSSTLPGYIAGENTQIANDDPECDYPSCY